MQPKNVIHYADKMNFVADELVDNIKYLSEENEQGQMPDDFHNELYKWSLESIGVVTMDTHLGTFHRLWFFVTKLCFRLFEARQCERRSPKANLQCVKDVSTHVQTRRYAFCVEVHKHSILEGVRSSFRLHVKVRL